jgi:hypothetical protein
MQMTLNLNLFPSEMIKDLTHVDDEFNKIHQHLQKIQKDTITDDIFNSMLIKNMLSSSSTLSPVLWTIFAISVSALPLLWCWYCNTLCQSRSCLRQICYCNKEAESSTPLHPLCPLHPNTIAPLPALDDEDKI